MSDNLKLWDSLFKTPFDQVKAITGKDYSGNSPKPYYIVKLLTETFGPCGIGWGYAIESERFERFSETDTLHVAKIRLWYVVTMDGITHRGEVEQMGQTKATYMTSKGQFKVDEDAPKKSVTDALVKCASYLGAAGDIFSGRWDDSKYVAELRKESQAPKAEANQHGKKVDRTLVMQVSRAIAEHVAVGHDLGALQEWEEAQATGEEFAGDVWSRLTTPERDKLRELQTAAAISPERAKVLKDEVRRIVAACRGLRTDSALEVYDKITDRREREYVWRELDSEPKVQDIITAAYEARKQPA